MAAKQRLKQGPYSGTQSGGFVCQEVIARGTFATTLEVRTVAGETVASHALDELSAGHQITPDGRIAYVLTGGYPSEIGLLRRLIAIDFDTGTIREVATSTSARPSVNVENVAYFTKDAVVVETHDGRRLFEHAVAPLGALHGGASHACALLPNGRIAFSKGDRSAERLADLSVLDVADGREIVSVALPADTSYDVFAISGLRADPLGRYVAILGHYAGMLIIDLETGEDIAGRFEPEQLDLADERPTLHANHTYSDLAFDAEGARLAAAYSPGKLSLWSRDGAILRREAISVYPKARRIVAFDGDAVSFADSMGTVARFV